jgi:hypothetical protein
MVVVLQILRSDKGRNSEAKGVVLIIPRTAVEGGEDILMRDSTPLATNPPLQFQCHDRTLSKA